MSDLALDISLTVNGEPVAARVEARKTLVDFLREDLGLTGSHVGCEHGVCGACTVRVDGEIVRGCLMLAVQCDGAKVETIEGLSDSGEVADLQAAFEQRNALQCGYCTPGMITAAQDLLLQTKTRAGVPSRDEIRAHLSGNYCRCTGYHAIVDAVESVAQQRAGGKP
jgi:carbon-monoxide dehydrogenase small subunit